MQPLNHCTHAIEQISSGLSGLHRAFPKDAAIMAEISVLLQMSVKFLLPDNGAIIDHSQSIGSFEVDVLHLPYPVISLEYEYTEFDALAPSLGRIDIKKRIALCVEITELLGTKIGSLASGHPDWNAIVASGGVALIALYYYQGVWFPYHLGLIVPRDQATGYLTQYNLTVSKNAPIGSRVAVSLFPLLESACRDSFSSLGVEATSENALNDLSEEYYALANVLVALACNNVTAEASIPAPEKLNKKRALKGRTPLFGYHEIFIKSHANPTGTSKNSPTSHASPKTHLRRGHVRNLGDGRRTWVTATVVNPATGKTPDKPLYKIM